jgi:RimJ/RimL family protein N-acetyltransferase
MLKEDISRRSVEIGYLVGEMFWGKGIATEAVKRLLQFIEQKLDMVRVFAHVFEHNTASMKVLRKNGFYLESIQRKAVVKNNQVMDDYVWVKLLA